MTRIRHPAPRGDGALEQNQAIGNVLVDGLADYLVFPFEVIDTVLLMGKSSATLAAHEGVLLPALVLEVAVQVVVPVVGSLTVWASEHTFRTAGKLLNIALSFPFPPFLGWLLRRVKI